MNINRFLSRREKDGRPHRREKSRDKSIDKKVIHSETCQLLDFLPRVLGWSFVLGQSFETLMVWDALDSPSAYLGSFAI